jgi:CysZ protein
MDPVPANAALAPRGALPLARSSRLGFFDGVRAPFAGLAFLARTPACWPLALVPVVIATALSVVLGWTAVHFLPDLVAGWIGATSGVETALSIVAQVLATALALVVAVLASIALSQPLSGPALEGIVRRHEAALGLPPRPEVGFWAGLSASMSSLAVSFAFGAPVLLVLFLLSAFVPGAAIVCVPLKLVVSALLLAWDLCDYPLSVRGIPVGDRVQLVRRNVPAMLGFGLAVALACMVPCGLFLMLPAGVAGAARLTHAIGERERGNPAPGRA